MFLLRGFLVSVSVFVLSYTVLSAMVALTWRGVLRFTENWNASSAARRLLWLRFAPVTVSGVIVCAFAVPSFVRFEPRASNEAIGAIPLLAIVVLGAFAVSGAWRVAGALRRTSSVVAGWMRNGREERVVGVPVITAFGDVPAVALTGICRSKLMISRAAASNLDEHELARAVEHEMAHMRARDNLKKLMLQAVAFPGMRRLERAWADAVELSADAEAVHSESEALELASALIKISRLRASNDLPVLASGLVDGPSSLLEVRVHRLVNWTAAKTTPAVETSWFVAASVCAGVLISNYAAVLRAAHAFTEVLVR